MSNWRIGQIVKLLDGPSGRIVRITYGREYGDPVVYVTVVNTLGDEVTRWFYANHEKNAR